MKVAVGECRAEQVVMVGIAVRIVVPGDVPDVGKPQNGRELLLQRARCLQVAEEHDRVGPTREHDLDDVLEPPVRVAHEEDVGLALAGLRSQAALGGLGLDDHAGMLGQRWIQDNRAER